MTITPFPAHAEDPTPMGTVPLPQTTNLVFDFNTHKVLGTNQPIPDSRHAKR